MMTYIYHGVLGLSFIVSLVAFKYHKGFRVIPYILGMALLIECLVRIVGYGFNRNPFILYHFYCPIDYALTGFFFYQLVEDKRIKKAVIYSIAFYIVISLSLSFFFYDFNDFPGITANMTGLLVIVFSAYVLLTLEPPVNNIPIFKHPLAWICVGMIVFYTGTFFFNGLHNYLILTKSQNKNLIHAIINQCLNCFMYFCIIVGLICSHRLKKYMQPVLPAK